LWDSSPISQNPMLMSPTTGNVHLQAGSPAIGAGTTTAPSAAVDFDNLTRPSPPSIGAFEYQAAVGSPPVMTNLQIASAAAGLASNFAPDEVVSVFNVTGLNGDTTASPPPPTSLGNVMVTITDITGVARPAQLYGVFATQSQVNLVVPGGTALGQAVLELTGPSGDRHSAPMSITHTAPGIFTANGNGRGVYAGQVVHVHGDGSQTIESSAAYDPARNSFVPNPVNLGPPSDQVILVLYGTGIRHGIDGGGVSAIVGGESVQVQTAAQATYPGLDQVNLQLPRTLAGSGTVNVIVTVEGRAANAVTVAIQ